MTDSVLSRWQEFRDGVPPEVGDGCFHDWLFGEVAQGSDANSHAFFVLEVAIGMAEAGVGNAAFLLLYWVGMHYADHPEPGVAVPAVMSVTDDCMMLGTHDPEHNNGARDVLRAVVDHAADHPSPEVQRAVARALVHLAYLRGERTAPAEGKAAELAALWTEIAQRWSGSPDAELRERAAQALNNRAFLALQDDDEQTARESFAEVVRHFGEEAPPPGSELERWVTIATNAPAILDRLVIGEPEFQLGYLERQRQFHPGTQMEQLTAGARREHARSAGAVRGWVCSGEPFVLLLRNYELTERSGVSIAPRHLLEEEGGDHIQTFSHQKSEPVLTEFASAVPLVQVASTTAGELEVNPFPGQFVAPNRLYLPTASWFGTVCDLIDVAGQIVVWADLLTPSLNQELDELVARGRAGDTLIVLEEPADDGILNIYLPARHGRPLTADDPVLAPFPHVVHGAELDGKRLGECPALLDVGKRLHQSAQEPVTARLARIRGRLDAAGPRSR